MSRDTRHRDLPAPVRRLAFFRSLLEPILLEPILLESTIPMPCL